MAQKVQIHLIDDLTGEDAQETVRFGLDGISCQIDLTIDNDAMLRETLDPYRANGRKVGRQPATASSREEMQKICQWAKENGHNPSSSGRLSGEIIGANRAAHH